MSVTLLAKNETTLLGMKSQTACECVPMVSGMMMLLITLFPPSPDVACYDETAEAVTASSEPRDASAEAKNAPC